jgi:hypothetical protein
MFFFLLSLFSYLCNLIKTEVFQLLCASQSFLSCASSHEQPVQSPQEEGRRFFFFETSDQTTKAIAAEIII